MTITKYGHACLLIENNGKKLLIDPGAFTFTPEFTPAQVGPVDVIVVTHHHFDHMSPEAIQAFANMQPVVVIGGEEVKRDLEKEGIKVVVLGPGSPQEIKDFTIESFEAKHEEIPGGIPQNRAYFINNTLLHVGDSYATAGIPRQAKILALPTQGPWSRLVDCLAFAEELNPKAAIPIHNYIYRDEIGRKFDERIQDLLKPKGIEVNILGIGESWTQN